MTPRHYQVTNFHYLSTRGRKRICPCVLWLVCTHCNLCISSSFHGPLVDVSWSNDHILIIHNHSFRVHINHESPVLPRLVLIDCPSWERARNMNSFEKCSLQLWPLAKCATISSRKQNYNLQSHLWVASWEWSAGRARSVLSFTITKAEEVQDIICCRTVDLGMQVMPWLSWATGIFYLQGNGLWGSNKLQQSSKIIA